MGLFRVFVDESIFYHPSLSQLAITEAKVTENAENIDCLSLSAPHNHVYWSFLIRSKGDQFFFYFLAYKELEHYSNFS